MGEKSQNVVDGSLYDFNLSFKLSAKKQGSDEVLVNLSYNQDGSTEYIGVVGIQGLLAKMGVALSEFGFDNAVVKGTPVEVVNALKAKLRG